MSFTLSDQEGALWKAWVLFKNIHSVEWYGNQSKNEAREKEKILEEPNGESGPRQPVLPHQEKRLEPISWKQRCYTIQIDFLQSSEWAEEPEAEQLIQQRAQILSKYCPLFFSSFFWTSHLLDFCVCNLFVGGKQAQMKQSLQMN